MRMASAVFEAAQVPRYAEVPVRVLPGLSAVQTVAARRPGAGPGPRMPPCVTVPVMGVGILSVVLFSR
ncbi:hypothetical protein EV190_101370 [Actinorugispora endophytica]|uniref:Uncharacterized protein n=1 Tax=Actinorugispora endophytica TaxID=1605990 RepID=A0A4R6V8G4_9ACTN|nr:hypothetical protein EV190_101370 [Actinorugispora endophytica]